MSTFMQYMTYKNLKIRLGQNYMTFMEYVIFEEQMRLTNSGH